MHHPTTAEKEYLQEKLGEVWVVARGGGYCGAVQPGFMGSLIEWGIIPHGLIGSSVGALVLSRYAEANRHELTEWRTAHHQMRGIWKRVEHEGWRSVFPVRLWRIFLWTLGRRESILSGRSLYRLLEGWRPERTTARGTPYFGVVLENGGRVIMSNRHPCILRKPARLVRGIVASASLKDIFPPVPIQGKHYRDPYSVDFSPIPKTAETVFVLNTRPLSAPTDSFGRMWYHMLGENGSERREIARFKRSFPGRVITLEAHPAAWPRSLSTIWFRKGDITAAYKAGRRAAHCKLQHLAGGVA